MPCTEAYKEHIMYTFNGFCKTVIHYAALNAWRDRSRRRQKEISLEWLTGEDDYSKGVEWINERYHIPLVLVSMGKQGSRAYYNNMMVEAAPFLQKAADSGNIEQIRSVCFVLLTNNSPFTYFPF